MTRMEKLRKLALVSCNFRGHLMGRFKYDEAHTTGTSTCKICGKEVQIIIKPKPNETYIAGEALALSCED